jgi:hypothetical protein
MQPATEQLIEHLTADAEHWEQAARDIDGMLPKIPELDREHWRKQAQIYRKRASDCKTLIDEAKTASGADGS